MCRLILTWALWFGPTFEFIPNVAPFHIPTTTTPQISRYWGGGGDRLGEGEECHRFESDILLLLNLYISICKKKVALSNRQEDSTTELAIWVSYICEGGGGGGEWAICKRNPFWTLNLPILSLDCPSWLTWHCAIRHRSKGRSPLYVVCHQIQDLESSRWTHWATQSQRNLEWLHCCLDLDCTWVQSWARSYGIQRRYRRCSRDEKSRKWHQRECFQHQP